MKIYCITSIVASYTFREPIVAIFMEVFAERYFTKNVKIY